MKLHLTLGYLRFIKYSLSIYSLHTEISEKKYNLYCYIWWFVISVLVSVGNKVFLRFSWVRPRTAREFNIVLDFTVRKLSMLTVYVLHLFKCVQREALANREKKSNRAKQMTQLGSCLCGQKGCCGYLRGRKVHKQILGAGWSLSSKCAPTALFPRTETCQRILPHGCPSGQKSA